MIVEHVVDVNFMTKKNLDDNCIKCRIFFFTIESEMAFHQIIRSKDGTCHCFHFLWLRSISEVGVCMLILLDTLDTNAAMQEMCKS